jgi:Holliday junction resolvase RusA-like endonuclease
MLVRSKTYCIPIPPISWKRAAMNGSRFFDPQTKEKVTFGIYLLQQHNDEPLFECPIHIDLSFHMIAPKSMKNHKKFPPHGVAPDVDNLVKFILDAIKDVLIKDDRQVASISARKLYDKEPRTIITITEIDRE